ncbi:hypothetical protein ANANG_G00051630 [Anguilla anguilla]|uniref:Arf-GAP domain-containing protein n=1 Tax=Anguilla anguilla TaxID=7936 RepID=A0A9D3MV77_ANGAN|nr:hypothetical protein ANANG_G00051630 [Anguilla anguilla]
MTTRSEREKAQKLNEQHQAILSKMLREEDNKYCADCEAKGPRWASWNLGVFICIRCAGIHRNLGVHISRVKSVNLDQWTAEQIQSAFIATEHSGHGQHQGQADVRSQPPDSFRRPQTDQAVEFFIRDKYERKKYHDKNAASVPSRSSDAAVSSPSSQVAERSKLEKEKEKREDKRREKEPDKGSKPPSYEKPQKREEPQPEPKASPAKSAEPAIDLLGLDTPAVSAANGSSATATLSDDLDIFGPMVSNPLPSTHTQFSQASSSDAAGVPATAGTGSSAPAQGDLDLFSESSSKADDSAKKLLSKDSILSLYSTSSMGQQPAL